MTPYLKAQLEALWHSLMMVEETVTQPPGLKSDLRSVREVLTAKITTHMVVLPDSEESAIPFNIPEVTLSQALDSLSVARGSLDMLLSSAVIDIDIGSSCRMVLDRAEVNLGNQYRRKQSSKLRGLYVIVDPTVTRHDIIRVAEDSLNAGAQAIQLRDKMSDKGKQLPLARYLKGLCEQHQALFLANDNADIAIVSKAHGLHLGQTDLPIAEARRLLIPQQIIGCSTNTTKQAMDAEANGADYIAVGAMFPTVKGANNQPAKLAGTETLALVRQAVRGPLVAIGGITTDNVERVIEAGADAICVISSVSMAKNPGESAKYLVDLIENALRRRGR